MAPLITIYPIFTGLSHPFPVGWSQGSDRLTKREVYLPHSSGLMDPTDEACLTPVLSNFMLFEGQGCNRSLPMSLHHKETNLSAQRGIRLQGSPPREG